MTPTGPDPVPTPDSPPTTKERALTLPNLLLLLFAVLAAAGGQLMLKHGMTGVAETVARDGGSVLIRAIAAPWVWAGLVVFGISALAWLTTLSRVPLSVAYPFNAIGLLTIVAASAVVLHEKVTALAWLGVFLVAGGLVMVVLAQNAAH